MRDSYYSGGIVRECKRLRKVPESLIAELWYKNETTPYYQVPSYYTFYSCYLLDEVKNFPVSPVKINSNGHFSCFLNRCFLLKSFTFAPYEGEVDWNMILIDLKESVGHSVYSTLREYGVPDDKKVSSAEDYERLKNDPDWYTSTYSYSKYNKISAIETINSLPKVTGACTINFKGRAGELTDGGAINTMTEEEIAVATEKGWNVTFSQKEGKLLKQKTFTLMRYDADEGKVFDYKERRFHVDQDGNEIEEHLNAKTIFIGRNDDIENYVEVAAPVEEVQLLFYIDKEQELTPLLLHKFMNRFQMNEAPRMQKWKTIIMVSTKSCRRHTKIQAKYVITL